MTMRVASAQAQAISAERAAGFVRSGMWLDYGTGLCQPDVFDRALGARIHELTNVKIRHCLTMRPRAVARRRSRRPSCPFGSACTSPATTGKSTTAAAAITSRSILARSRTTTGASSTRSTSSSSRPARSTKAAISI